MATRSKTRILQGRSQKKEKPEETGGGDDNGGSGSDGGMVEGSGDIGVGREGGYTTVEIVAGEAIAGAQGVGVR